MSKNMTRKGLAFGAGAALIATGLVGLPSNAAGLADTSFVSLTPSTGTEYTVLSGAGNTFSLTANEAATVSVGNLKFLVTDLLAVIEPTAATTGRTFALGADAAGTTVATAADKVVTVTMANTLSQGDRINLSADLVDTTDQTVYAAAADGPYTVITAVAGSFTFQGGAGATANTGAEQIQNAVTFEVIREARSALTGTFVVDSGVSSATTNETLVLATDGATTRSVTVQAWMDANGNDKIDSTEHASPVRTITWIKPSEVVAQTTLAPIVGATSLNAVITTTPVLNGEQTLATNPVAINAAVTRSLSTTTAFADNTDTSGATANTSSIWDDDDKTFTVSVNTDADNAVEASDAAGANLADAWGGLAAPISGADNIDTMAVSTAGVVSVVTVANHQMVSGDKVTFALASVAGGNSVDAAFSVADVTGATVTVTGDKTFTYAIAASKTAPTTAIAALALQNDNDTYAVATYAGATGLVDRVGAETYTAQATVAGALNGLKVSTGVVAAAASSLEVSSTASATVQGKVFTATGVNTTFVKTGEKTVPVTVTVLDADGDAVGAGRPVVFALTKSGTVDSFKVNGKSADTVLTDADGTVTVQITAGAGNAGAKLQVAATAENVASADIDLEWADASFGLVDLATTDGTLTAGNIARNMIKLSSYDLNLMVADQWFNVPAAGTYRLNVSGEGVDAKYVTLVDGKATVKVTDTGVFGDSVDAIVKLEKMSGTTVVSTSTFTFQSALATSYKVALGASGQTLYGNAVVASVAVAKKALVEIDKRLASTVTPAYANNLVLNGLVSEKATSAAKPGAVVTISGPTNILFEHGQVAKRGSLTLLADANGKFEVKAYSTTAQTASVVTVTTADGATSTIKVSFTGTGVGEGTNLTVTVPAAVKPASTFKVSASLKDAYGNPVDTAASRIKVTHTGAGIVYGTLPTETDAFGELSFSVLLGSNDSGNISFQVQYDQNGDGDFKDAKDLSVTETVVINATGTVASSDQKVNAGSFKGYVALYAKGYEGKRMSAKVGNDWVVVPVLASNFERVVEFTGAGYTVAVRIYIDRVLIDTITVTTK